MHLKINGISEEVSAGTVSDLLKHYDLHQDTVVVEINKTIIHRQKFSETALQENDKIEVVTIVGGG